MSELPTMMASAYASSTLEEKDIFGGLAAQNQIGGVERRINAAPFPFNVFEHKGQTAMANPARRLVQVFIADSNENIPVADCLLYSGEQKLTDLTDQELFFEIEVKILLEKHNEKRVKVINKAVKDRTEYLEPAKIRDLKMVVTTVASF